MTLKSDVKFEEKLTFGNLVNFNPTSGKSENIQFDVLLLSTAYKVYMISTKNVQKKYFMTLKNDPKLWRKIDFLFEKWYEEFGKFHLSSEKPRGLNIHGILL